MSYIRIAKKDSSEGKNNLREWLVGTKEEPGFIPREGLSVEEFARKCGLTRGAMYYFLSDTNRPTPETLARICKEAGVSLEEGLKYVDPRATGKPRSLNASKRAVARRRSFDEQILT